MAPQETQEDPDMGREEKLAPVTVRTLLSSQSGPKKVQPSVTVKRKVLPIQPHALAADMVQTCQKKIQPQRQFKNVLPDGVLMSDGEETGVSLAWHCTQLPFVAQHAFPLYRSKGRRSQCYGRQ